MLDVLNRYSLDTENAQNNFDLASEYDSLHQTASAISFYLRAAERSENKELSYVSLLRMGLCFERQGGRDQTVRGAYQQAITVLPKRPEAYYLLARIQNKLGLYHEAYTNIEIALSFLTSDEQSLQYDVSYPGIYGLFFEKAISSWWWGKNQESRDLFRELFEVYFDLLDQDSKNIVIDNISRLGYTSNTQAVVGYDSSKHSSLRFHFSGSDTIERNHSQVYQDMFVLSMLNGKRNGTFLEVGSAHAYHNSNTALLESKFDWSGVAIELKKDLADEYASSRKSKILNVNALELDYKKLLDDNFSSNVIDYLQLDIEPAKNTYEVLLKIPFDDYKFAVITYEHDHYVDTTKECRQKSREYLRSKGYVLVVNDISADGVSSFEDWWIHPDLVDKKIKQIMSSIDDNIKNVEEYMNKSILLNKDKKIIDYFRFFNEKELLELRYHILKDKVDKFVIVQGTKTFSGIPTELLAEKYIKELNLPEDRFIVINVDLPENSEDLHNNEIDICFRSLSGPSTDIYKNSLNTRTRERMVMDGIISILSQFDEDDIFLVSDCDEIINPEHIDNLINVVIDNPDKLIKIPLVELQGRANLRVYDLQTSSNVMKDDSVFICTKKHFNVCSPTQLRYNIFNPYKNENQNEECGWHFSWMGDSNRKKIKCKSFAHYSDYIESAEVKDLSSSQMESFFDEWEPSIGGVNPWGNKNLILKEYDENKLPKEIWQLEKVKEFLFGNSSLKENTLTDLFLKNKYDTDKYQLGYITEFYSNTLQDLRKTPINFLEIGTYRGGSVKLWKDYFHSDSNIITGDIIDCKNKIKNVNYILGDLYSDEIVSQFQDNYFHLIIDDGPHTLESFNFLIKKYYSKLKLNGTLIIEDIINESYLSPLIMLAKEIGYTSYTIIDMSNKQLNDEWKNDWKNGLYILRIDK